VRSYALSLPYEEAKTSEEKTYYKGLLTTPYHQFAQFGSELIAEALRRVIYWNSPNGEFRILIKNQDTNELGRTWIHYDSMVARYAAIVYLNPPDQCQGGTSFYRHRELGWDYLPDPQSTEMLQALQQTGLRWDQILEKLKDEGFDIEEKWEHVIHVPMRFNRCVIFDGRQFHARTGSFGTSLTDGRLTQNFFFDIAW